jgi:hypothetical protein
MEIRRASHDPLHNHHPIIGEDMNHFGRFLLAFIATATITVHFCR